MPIGVLKAVPLGIPWIQPPRETALEKVAQTMVGTGKEGSFLHQRLKCSRVAENGLHGWTHRATVSEPCSLPHACKNLLQNSPLHTLREGRIIRLRTSNWHPSLQKKRKYWCLPSQVVICLENKTEQILGSGMFWKNWLVFSTLAQQDGGGMFSSTQIPWQNRFWLRRESWCSGNRWWGN